MHKQTSLGVRLDPNITAGLTRSTGMICLVIVFMLTTFGTVLKLLFGQVLMHMYLKTSPSFKEIQTTTIPKIYQETVIKKSIIWRSWKSNKKPDTKEKYTKIANDCRLAIHKYIIHTISNVNKNFSQPITSVHFISL